MELQMSVEFQIHVSCADLRSALASSLPVPTKSKNRYLRFAVMVVARKFDIILLILNSPFLHGIFLLAAARQKANDRAGNIIAV